MSAPAPVLIPRSRLPFAPLTDDAVRDREIHVARMLADRVADGRGQYPPRVAEYVDLRHRADLSCGYVRTYPDGSER